MLKYRLIFGVLITAIFTGLVLLGGWFDGFLTTSTADDKTIKGSVLAILIALLIIPAQKELKSLAEAKKNKLMLPVTIPAAILFAVSWYVLQFLNVDAGVYLSTLAAATLLGLFFYQNRCYGIEGVWQNCGVSIFSIIYLGILSSFVLGIYIEFGLYIFLMFIFTVKVSDIGAYTVGKICGVHKFSPRISPKKTWEGMAGAAIAAAVTSVVFSVKCDIMAWYLAVVFGICFAFLGQLGDLAESMLKRDAQTKDASNSIPGFGGILDIIDSPLGTAVFAYWFFKIIF